MILFKKAADLHNHIDSQRKKGKSISFVPTMGALHAGHISLIEAARKTAPLTVCSIFVNPTQFNDPKDFARYPVTIDKDIRMLEAAGCDLLFLPDEQEVYPDGPPTGSHYDLGFLETVLEGAFRPGHFQGVCMVVQRLLEMVNPDHLFLGQKDYQQCMVITRLIELMGAEQRIKIHLCPTLREPDGLAMSSRNMRLNATERITAAEIYKTITYIKERLAPGDLQPLLASARRRLEDAGFRLDYLDLTDTRTLAPVKNWDGQQHLVVLVAAFLQEVRLIDNMVIA